MDRPYGSPASAGDPNPSSSLQPPAILRSGYTAQIHDSCFRRWAWHPLPPPRCQPPPSGGQLCGDLCPGPGGGGAPPEGAHRPAEVRVPSQPAPGQRSIRRSKNTKWWRGGGRGEFSSKKIPYYFGCICALEMTFSHFFFICSLNSIHFCLFLTKNFPFFSNDIIF